MEILDFTKFSELLVGLKRDSIDKEIEEAGPSPTLPAGKRRQQRDTLFRRAAQCARANQRVSLAGLQVPLKDGQTNIIRGEQHIAEVFARFWGPVFE